MISSFDVIAPQTNNIFIIVHVDIKRQYYIIPSQIKPLIYEPSSFFDTFEYNRKRTRYTYIQVIKLRVIFLSVCSLVMRIL